MKKRKEKTEFLCPSCGRGTIILSIDYLNYVYMESCSICNHVYIFEADEKIPVEDYINQVNPQPQRRKGEE